MINITQKNHPVPQEFINQVRQSYDQLLSRKDIGFHQLCERTSLWTESQEVGEKLRSQFTDLVVIGVGGSSLGPLVLRDIFQMPGAKHRLHFCDNVDPDAFSRLLMGLPSLQTTGWLIISKSGSTIETLVTTDFVLAAYQAQGLDFYKHVTVISETRKNPLTVWANEHRLRVLEIPVDVGGRYSVLTPVGMVPAAFLGIPVEKFRQGALQALSRQDLTVELAAQSLMSFQRQEWISFLFIYSSLLAPFGPWWRQLWSESLAKKTDRSQGPAARVSTPMLGVGVGDQHSILQQLMEGARDKFVLFMRVKSSENQSERLKATQFPIHDFMVGRTMGNLLSAEAQATAHSLQQESVSTLTIEVENLSPEIVGHLFMTWQLVVPTIGEFLNIDSFDQPGVELGKRLAKEILKSSVVQ